MPGLTKKRSVALPVRYGLPALYQ